MPAQCESRSGVVYLPDPNGIEQEITVTYDVYHARYGEDYNHFGCRGTTYCTETTLDRDSIEAVNDLGEPVPVTPALIKAVMDLI